jgi:hypothetical protein
LLSKHSAPKKTSGVDETHPLAIAKRDRVSVDDMADAIDRRSAVRAAHANEQRKDERDRGAYCLWRCQQQRIATTASVAIANLRALSRLSLAT